MNGFRKVSQMSLEELEDELDEIRRRLTAEKGITRDRLIRRASALIDEIKRRPRQ